MKALKGVAWGLDRYIIGKLTKEHRSLSERKHYILVTDKINIGDVGYAGIILLGPLKGIALKITKGVALPLLTDFMFNNGDIAYITEDGTVSLTWESQERHNAILTTESCNCKCIMCPQPPKPHDNHLVALAYKTLGLVPSDYNGNICLTGGEPTLLGEEFLKLLTYCSSLIPNASISVLTNAKKFSNFDFTRSVALLGLKNFMICASLHADTDDIHDMIVGTKGSFTQTQKGLYNLAKFSIPVEVRVVVNRFNHTRLIQIAEFIYRNFPFAAHIAYMGMEITGLAYKNINDIWVDMHDYMSSLEIATHELHRRGVCVSIYNHPLCLLPKSSWAFARQSISSWKNNYLNICTYCIMKNKCCGFFTTSNNQLSAHIRPISPSNN